MLTGKIAIITGGSEGIGLGIAKEFANHGATVCLIGRNQERLEAAKRNIAGDPESVITIAHDLGDTERLTECVSHIRSRVERIDVLVNNAAIGRFLPFLDTSEDELNDHINTNIKAPFLLTQKLLPSLMESRGSVINISSYFAHRMLPGRSTTAYSMTKGALNAWTAALAFELGEKGVRVNAIAPGSVRTTAFDNNLARLDDDAKLRFQNMVGEIYPLRRLGTPKDIGDAAVFLASDHASWITGQVIAVDGGLTTN
ncbi:SDR family NAD(P)-dependent oxidoreductase [Erwinia sp. V71]|uniref:SDR family NAD(P)-dependent oxidoreductase n=1 Tax=Erwinia sp. V71 TaxID=3369424 RepID=UPI003F5DA6A8